jgi:hypothetical protein
LNCGNYTLLRRANYRNSNIKGFTNNPKLYPAFQFNLGPFGTQIDKSGDSFYPLLKNIADWLKVSLILRKFNNHSQFNITTTNNVSNDILIDYLTHYPLFTSKYLNYLDWVRAYKLVNEKKDKNPEIYKEIKNLKLNMNKNRKIFLWEHLTNCY